jgi:5,10-methylenetetrahydrofolate reductase
MHTHGHKAFNLVGAASSNQGGNLSLTEAGQITSERSHFGCVCIPERHTTKANEHLNMMRKIRIGSSWFITQGIFNAKPLISLLHDYSDLCKQEKIIPRKVVLTFAPCGRPKTMTFIKWLGMQVPTDIEERIFASSTPVQESTNIACEILTEILKETKGLGVPLGINVESLSIFKEEIDAAHDLFQRLQVFSLFSCNFF